MPLWPSILLGAEGASFAAAWQLIASGFTAAFVFLFVLAIAIAFRQQTDKAGNIYDDARRARLRAGSWTFRTFEPLVDQLASIMPYRSPNFLSRLEHTLQSGVVPLPWRPMEFAATRQIEGGLAGILLGACTAAAYPPAPLIAIPFAVPFAAWCWEQLCFTNLLADEQNHLARLKNRLPFAMDLMALMMQAGATFPEALATTVREEREHPIGVELAAVLRETELGRSRADAFRGALERWQDSDLREVVVSILRGQEMGTPLAETLAEQAEQLRLKRSQWIEKASGEAEVKIVYPGMLIMLACLVIMTAPFLLRLLEAMS